MPECCRPGDFDSIFSADRAEKDARTYERDGLSEEARWIFERSRPAVERGGSVLEVGGGVGAIQVELLRAGASSTTNIELSRGYEASAARLLERAGLEGRTTRRLADFVAESATLAPADVVVLQRVVCCYPDPVALVGAAARLTRSRLALTFPVPRVWMPLVRAAINAWPMLTRSTFRFYVHPTAVVISAAEREGLRLAERERGLVWQRLLFTRA